MQLRSLRGPSARRTARPRGRPSSRVSHSTRSWSPDGSGGSRWAKWWRWSRLADATASGAPPASAARNRSSTASRLSRSTRTAPIRTATPPATPPLYRPRMGVDSLSRWVASPELSADGGHCLSWHNPSAPGLRLPRAERAAAQFPVPLRRRSGAGGRAARRVDGGRFAGGCPPRIGDVRVRHGHGPARAARSPPGWPAARPAGTGLDGGADPAPCRRHGRRSRPRS